MSRVGIYSGTFDPVHQGHIAFCRAAVEANKLDEVWLLPEREPREKKGVTPFDERVHMLQLAVADEPAVQVLLLPYAQFTVRTTLPALMERFAHDELFLLLGSDVARTFTYRWEGLRELLRSVSLIIGMREGDEQREVHTILRTLELEYSVPLRYTIIKTSKPHVASLRIRRQYTTDELNPRVAAYIAAQQLYKQDKIAI